MESPAAVKPNARPAKPAAPAAPARPAAPTPAQRRVLDTLLTEVVAKYTSPDNFRPVLGPDNLWYLMCVTPGGADLPLEQRVLWLAQVNAQLRGLDASGLGAEQAALLAEFFDLQKDGVSRIFEKERTRPGFPDYARSYAFCNRYQWQGKLLAWVTTEVISAANHFDKSKRREDAFYFGSTVAVCIHELTHLAGGRLFEGMTDGHGPPFVTLNAKFQRLAKRQGVPTFPFPPLITQ